MHQHSQSLMDITPPNLLRRTQTINRMPDLNAGLSISQNESPHQSFEGFRTQFKLVPNASQKHLTIKLGKSSSVVKILPLASPNVTQKNQTFGSKMNSLGVSPVRQRPYILSRKNTIDVQACRDSEPRRLHLPSFKETINPIEIRRENPKVLVRSRSGTLSPIKPFNREVRSTSVRKYSQGTLRYPFNKPIATLPDQDSEELEDGERKINKAESQKEEGLSSHRTNMGELEYEEDPVAKKIADQGTISFQQILKMYKKFNCNHLFEPETKCLVQRNLTLKVKAMISNKQSQDAGGSCEVKGINVVKKELEASTMPVATVPSIGRIFNEVLENKSIMVSNHSRSKSSKNNVNVINEQKEEEERGQSEKEFRISDSANLKKMRELSEALKIEKPLTKEEKDFLQLVKQGTQIPKITELLSTNKELLNIKDTVNSFIEV